MTNQEKKVPELRFPEFDGEWDITTIEKIAKVSKGFTPSTKDINLWQNDNKNWLSIAGMSDKYIYEGNKGISSAGEGKHKKVNKDTLIMSFKLTLGKLAIVKTPIYTNEAICHFEWKTNQLKTEYMYYYLSFINIKSFGAQAVKGITLNNDSINSILIKLPGFLEQEKIGTFFSKLDRQIELEEQKLEKLKEQKKGYMQKIFSQELRFKDKNGNDYPDWKSSKIENQLKERNERSGEGQMLSVTINSGIVKFNELDRKDNSSKDKSNYKVVKKDDIAYNSMRMWQGASGKSDYDGIVSPAYTVIYPTQSTSSAFIEYKFKTYRMIHTFKINSQGLTSDTWNLKYKQLKNINIDMPVLKEQEKIGSFFKKIDQLINKQKEKVEILQKNKNGFLQKMFV